MVLAEPYTIISKPVGVIAILRYIDYFDLNTQTLRYEKVRSSESDYFHALLLQQEFHFTKPATHRHFRTTTLRRYPCVKMILLEESLMLIPDRIILPLIPWPISRRVILSFTGSIFMP